MASVNKVILIGALGRDPEVRSFPNGGRIANTRIATSERWKDKQSGEAREATEWHNVVFADRLAEIAEQYLRKGSAVYVEGSLRTRKWQDKDGQERYTTEIRADRMQMLSGRPESSDAPAQAAPPARAPAPPPSRSNGYADARQGRAPAPAPRASSGFDDMADDMPPF